MTQSPTPPPKGLPPPPPTAPSSSKVPPDVAVEAQRHGQTRGLKSVVGDHPLFVALGVLTLGVAVGAIPVVFIERARDAASAEQDYEITQLESDLASVTREVGNGVVMTLDLNDIIISEVEARGLDNAETEFVSEDAFYIAPPDGWSYRNMTEEERAREAGWPDEVISQMGEGRHQTVHEWASNEGLSVTFEGRELTMLSQLTLQRLEGRLLFETIAATLGLDPAEGAALAEGYRAAAASDPLGVVLQQRLLQSFSTNTATAVTVIRDVQRTDDVVYLQTADVYTDAVVDGTKVEHFYVEQEFIFVPDGDDIIAISTQVPTVDWLTDDFSTVTRVLESVHIVE